MRVGWNVCGVIERLISNRNFHYNKFVIHFPVFLLVIFFSLWEIGQSTMNWSLTDFPNRFKVKTTSNWLPLPSFLTKVDCLLQIDNSITQLLHSLSKWIKFCNSHANLLEIVQRKRWNIFILLLNFRVVNRTSKWRMSRGFSKCKTLHTITLYLSNPL